MNIDERVLLLRLLWRGRNGCRGRQHQPDLLLLVHVVDMVWLSNLVGHGWVIDGHEPGFVAAAHVGSTATGTREILFHISKECVGSGRDF